MSRLFDVYIAVDWSSRCTLSPRRPSPNAIWVGERLADGETSTETHFRTRLECQDHLRERLVHHTDYRRKVFIGFDFAYGYPAGLASALNLTDDVPPWRRIWNELARLIEDDARNRNNRFEVAAQLNARCGDPIPGPFWGCPASKRQPTLSSTSPGFPYRVRPRLTLQRLRRVETRQPNAQETWKLYGAGSVGGQILVGIPVVRALRDDARLSEFSSIWPFETGFTTTPTPGEGPFVLHVEIFPSNLRDPLEEGVIRDQAQVRSVVRWLSRLDGDGQLGSLFAAPEGLYPVEIDACVREEGWIIGS